MKVLLLISLILIGCSSNDSSGTTVVENGVVFSKINLKPTESSDISIKLIPSEYQPQEDSTSYIISTQIDSIGEFSFSNLKSGLYNIEIISKDDSKGILISGIEVKQDSLKVPPIDLQNLTSIGVYLPDSLNIDNLHIEISGSSIHKSQASTSTLENATSKFLFSQIPPSEMIDSISIYNEKQKVFTWYQQSTLSTEELSLSFSNQDLKSLRPIKYFSSIVGVSDSMVNHYKGIEVLTDSIKKQFLASQDVFTHEDLNQVIRFTIDSVYTYSGNIQDQKTPPSAEFDYKILYSPFVSYGSSNWDQENSIIAIVTPEGISDGVLGINSYKNVRQSLALSRGAYLNTIEEVILPNNLISNEEFVQAASIVNYRAENVTWSPYNIALLNSNINSPITKMDSLFLSSFSSLKINFTNQEGTPLDLANIQFYGVVPQSISVENTSILDLTTDTEGGISIASNPFLNPNKTGLSFSNFVIKCTYQGKDYFKWLPYSTLIESYWSNSNSDKDEYKHTFLINTL